MLINRSEDNCSNPVYILGAGPAGLAAAYTLTKQNIPIIIVEKGQRVGGLSKSINYQGFTVDYGAHFLATDNPLVRQLFDEILDSEQITINRLTRFVWRNLYFSYPPKIGELFAKISSTEIVKIATSYFKYKVFPIRSPQNHAEELQNKYGKHLYNIFFKDYLQKVWGCTCDHLAVDSVTGRANGFLSIWIQVIWRKVANLFKSKDESNEYEYQFQYPKLGLGQFYQEIANYLVSQNQKILLNTEVVQINHKDLTVNQIVLKDSQTGEKNIHNCRQVISSIPISLMLKQLVPSPPTKVIAASKSLKFRNTVLVYLIVEASQIFSDHCLYINNPNTKIVRITNYANWSQHTLSNNCQTPICCEYWCDFGDDIWNLSEQELLAKTELDMRKINVLDRQKINSGFAVKLPRTNPVYTKSYKKNKSEIEQYINQFHNLQVMGRGGSFSYSDQDRVLLMGISEANKIARQYENVKEEGVDSIVNVG